MWWPGQHGAAMTAASGRQADGTDVCRGGAEPVERVGRRWTGALTLANLGVWAAWYGPLQILLALQAEQSAPRTRCPRCPGEPARGGGLGGRQPAVRGAVGPDDRAGRAADALGRVGVLGGRLGLRTGRGRTRGRDGAGLVPGPVHPERRLRRAHRGGPGPGAAAAARLGGRLAGGRADPRGAGRHGAGDGRRRVGGRATWPARCSRCWACCPYLLLRRDLRAARAAGRRSWRGLPGRVLDEPAPPPRLGLGLADPLPDQPEQRRLALCTCSTTCATRCTTGDPDAGCWS